MSYSNLNHGHKFLESFEGFSTSSFVWPAISAAVEI